MIHKPLVEYLTGPVGRIHQLVEQYGLQLNVPTSIQDMDNWIKKHSNMRKSKLHKEMSKLRHGRPRYQVTLNSYPKDYRGFTNDTEYKSFVEDMLNTHEIEVTISGRVITFKPIMK